MNEASTSFAYSALQAIVREKERRGREVYQAKWAGIMILTGVLASPSSQWCNKKMVSLMQVIFLMQAQESQLSYSQQFEELVVKPLVAWNLQ